MSFLKIVYSHVTGIYGWSEGKFHVFSPLTLNAENCIFNVALCFSYRKAGLVKLLK